MQSAQAERRRSVRISPKGTIVLLAGEHVERGRVANISSGGLLAVTADRPPAALLDSEVGIELRLDAASSEWLQLTGRVLRIDGHEVAIELARAPEPFERLVEQSSSASTEHRRMRTVVLIDTSPERTGPLAEAFRAAGCVVLAVSTPLEAIVRLGESQFEPDLIAIAGSVPSPTSDELRRFAEREHPSAKLVTLGGDDLAGSMDDMIARIRGLLSC
jgi:hypothetical protein